MTDTFNGQIIDAWAQPVLKEGILPEVVRLFQQSGSAHLLGKELAAEQFVGLMDEAGVGRVMLSAWHRPGKWVISNDTVAEMVRQFPQRLVGVAAVNLEKPVEAVRELERAVKELGFKALRVVPWLWNRPPNDKFYFPLYVKCIELGIPFCTQVGHTGPLMPSETGRPVPYVPMFPNTPPRRATQASLLLIHPTPAPTKWRRFSGEFPQNLLVSSTIIILQQSLPSTRPKTPAPQH